MYVVSRCAKFDMSRQKTKATSKRQIGDGYKAADGVALPTKVAIECG